jgi:hypothetical protein
MQSRDGWLDRCLAAEQRLQEFENDRRDEIADLRVRPACKVERNRELAKRWQNSLKGHVYKAIATLRSKGIQKSEVAAIDHIAGDWLRRIERDRADCQAARRLDHAGLKYLATEINWSDILTTYGSQEASELIEDVVNCRYEAEVERIIHEWQNPDLSDPN